MDLADYHLYRYFILPSSNQLTIMNLTVNKEDLVANIWKDLLEAGKTDFIYRGMRFIIYGKKTHENELYFFRIAKENVSREYKEGEKDVIETDDTNLSVVNFVAHIKTQLILIQKNTVAFKETTTPINALKSFMTGRVYDNDYVVSIDEKPSNKKFWSYVDDSNGIYSLQLKLNSLNLNLGDGDIRDAIKVIKEDFNHEDMDITLRNSQGKLNLVKDRIDGYIKYISTLGGQYRLVFKAKNNVKKAITSLTNIISFKFQKDITKDSPQNIINKLKGISDKPDND